MTLGSAWNSPWPALWVAVSYCTLSTRDVEIGPIPGKFVVTVLALTLWLIHRGRQSAPEWRSPLVAMAIAFPVFGLAVAAIRDLSGDATQQLGLRASAEEASRFVYVLLALPMADWVQSRADLWKAQRVWFWPVIALATLTCGLYGVHLLGDMSGTGRVGPLQGDFGVDPTTGWFRAFMITNILFIPGLAILFARINAGLVQPSEIALLSLIAGAVLLSHTRGIWTGLVVACGMCLTLQLAIDRPVARPALRVVAVLLSLLVLGLAIPTLARSVTNFATGQATDQSSSVRIQQTPELLDSFERHPVIGSGLGGVPPSGYRRSDDTPWSFELTYLQLLFQGGLLGIALLAWLPLSVLRRTVRRLLMGPVHAEAQAAAIAGVATMSGLLTAYATNPYFTTSAGTLALAISITLCATARR